ncbi:MAG: putative sugar nucleotidyl transferase [Phycisphaerae bacterium]
MNIGFFEDDGWRNLLPLTWLRSAFELRTGRDTLLDKVATHVRGRVARVWVREALAPVVAERIPLADAAPAQAWALFNSRTLVTQIIAPPPPSVVWRIDGAVVAIGVTAAELERWTARDFLDHARLDERLSRFRAESPPAGVRLVTFPWELAIGNADELARQCRGGGECAGRVYSGAHLLNEREIRVAPGAVVKPGCVLDAETGPIEIDERAVLQPNAVVQGPCYIGRDAVVRPGAAIRGGTTIGPVCKVGGEIEATIFQGHGNKQHDGFLGHSFVGEWVNLGASTVSSDLKNTYGTIRVLLNGVEVETGHTLVGTTIGDHVKTGIGTILPTGCVLGVAANVFTTALVPRFVPSFSWLTEAGVVRARVDKVIAVARTMMARRKRALSDAEQKLIEDAAATARQIESGAPAP